ncbi:hypothetical protein SEA_FINKLE_62 [Gordonia phage Finkle]|uniref:Uncharacterized protein n=1 Tax=Gordonia phage Finkle TaxID=2926099 RepID=A0A9E7SZC9_9CAUD|nr:hypothetical protein QEH33_gp62 [Gordonia phage Finkle]UTN92976.1 hypothetical protein SEA_FINKLE_62 [Gordonia phage Finkle]
MTIDKTAMRKSGDSLDFALLGYKESTLDYRVIVEARTGDRWRVTVLDKAMPEGVCFVDDIRSDSTEPMELVRLALNAYREHRPLGAQA